MTNNNTESETAMTTNTETQFGGTRIFRVTMLVALHETGDSYDNLDYHPHSAVHTAIYACEYGEGVQIIGEPAVHEMGLTLAATQATKAVAVANTVPDDEDSVTDALIAALVQPAAVVRNKAAKKARRKRKHIYEPRKGTVAKRVALVLDTMLALQQQCTADEIATLSGVPVKEVYYDLNNLHKLKKVSATKTSGRVKWQANSLTTEEDK